MTQLTLNKEKSGIVIIDTQSKLMAVMRRKNTVVENIIKLLRLAKLFNMPVLLTEQYPKMMGTTLPEIKDALPAYDPVEKMDFNCCDVDYFNNRIEAAGLETIILAGVETHICILQTCLGLLEKGCHVHVPQDAVDSRTEENQRVGLDLMRQAGAVVTSTETVIFQILKKAGTKEFKEMLRVVR